MSLTDSVELDRATALLHNSTDDMPVHYKKIVNMMARSGTIIVDFGGYNRTYQQANRSLLPVITADNIKYRSHDLYIHDSKQIISSVACVGRGLRRLAMYDGNVWSLEQEFERQNYIEIKCKDVGPIVISFDQVIN